MPGPDAAARDLEAKWRAIVAASPDSAEAYLELGRVLQSQNQVEAARTCYAAARARAPHSVAAPIAEGDALLLLGRYGEGWPLFAWRTRQPGAGGRTTPVWNGESPAGRTILIDGLDDPRDAIQFLRYVPLIAAQAQNIMLAAPRELVRIAASLPVDNLQIVRDGGEAPPADLRCPLLGLPGLFKTQIDRIPGRVPYLTRRTMVERWARAIGDDGRLKVGVGWRGHGGDLDGTLGLAPLEPLFDVNGVAWTGLQSGDAAADLDGFPITDLSGQLTDLAETAAAILNLDLVIGGDGALAHLAGALGRPAWIMLPFAPDWRWLLDRTDSPWYPSLRLIRQPAPGAWEPVVAEVARTLGRLAERHAQRRELK